MKRFGPSDAALGAAIDVHDPRVYDAVAWRRSVGLGESYADRLWDSPDVILEGGHSVAGDGRSAQADSG